jgi:hypothetical protein
MPRRWFHLRLKPHLKPLPNLHLPLKGLCQLLRLLLKLRLLQLQL